MHSLALRPSGKALKNAFLFLERKLLLFGVMTPPQCKHDDIIIIVLESGQHFVPHLVEKNEYVKKPVRAR
eukprot:13335160-Ditylum_brightwellii.AAC.1